MTIINIRCAKLNDANAIALNHVASWQRIYRGHISDAILDNLSVKEREDRWHDLINQGVKILLLEVDHKIVGFASIGPSRDANVDTKKIGEISAVYLHPDVWFRGLGMQLCLAALSELKKMDFHEAIVWVLKENNQARNFYEKLGFMLTGLAKDDDYECYNLNEVQYKIDLANVFTFQPLETKHLDLLCTWLDKSHVKEWWNDGLSHQEIKDKYGERINDTVVMSFIAYLQDKPIGFIQYYHANQVGEGWWPDELPGTVGIDQYIGDEDFINKGYGTRMIRTFVSQLLMNPQIKKIITEVDPKNLRAKRCYEKSGFQFVKEINTPDGLCNLMVWGLQ